MLRRQDRLAFGWVRLPYLSHRFPMHALSSVLQTTRGKGLKVKHQYNTTPKPIQHNTQKCINPSSVMFFLVITLHLTLVIFPSLSLTESLVWLVLFHCVPFIIFTVKVLKIKHQPSYPLKMYQSLEHIIFCSY